MNEIYIYPFFRLFLLKPIIVETLILARNFFDQNEETIVTVAITTNQKIRSLNHKFRNTDQVTDVLSFNHDLILENGKQFLGEIIIAFPCLVQHAKKKKIQIRDELSLVLVHGFLHLNGYDHSTKKDKQEMWAVQDQILNDLGIDVNSLNIGE